MERATADLEEGKRKSSRGRRRLQILHFYDIH